MFKFQKKIKDYPLLSIEREIGRIKDLPKVDEWAEKNFRLSSSYARQGKFRPFPWQVEILNSFLKYDTIILRGPTQFGKSLLAEVMVAYSIDNLPMNTIFCYSKREVVQEVFESRVKPFIRETPCIRKYWSGFDDDLTRKRIKLNHLYMRVASAEARSDIASFGYGLIYASEVSKWKIKKGWNPLEALKRRQSAYRIIGRHKAIFESSPLTKGDCLNLEERRADVLRLERYLPCPSCGEYHRLQDKNIIEKPNRKGVLDHNPERIAREKAAFYRCPKCKRPIPEEIRPELDKKGVWAAENEKISRNGEITGRANRKSVAFHWDRLLDFGIPFADRLAAFYEARRAGSDTYQLFVNEDRAEFWEEMSKQLSSEYLLTRIGGYKAGSIPKAVLVLTMGVDVQDDGFYYVVRGYGRGMATYLIKNGFIKSAIKQSQTDSGTSIDPRQLAFERFMNGAWNAEWKREDGRKLEITLGFMDRGGHRAEDVDYITAQIPALRAYVGSPRLDYTKPFVEESKTGDHYQGQSERLSKEFGKIMGSKTFWLPDNIDADYLEQVKNEYFEPQPKRSGGTKLVWVKVNPNHYRSCENYAHAAAKMLELDRALFDESTIREIEQPVPAKSQRQVEIEQDENGPDSDYFARRGF